MKYNKETNNPIKRTQQHINSNTKNTNTTINMKLFLLTFIIAFGLSNCLPDKSEINNKSANATSTVNTAINPPVNTNPNTAVNTTANASTNTTTQILSQGTTAKEPEEEKPAKPPRLGKWAVENSIVIEGFEPVSIAAFLGFAVINDPAKDSAYVMDIKTGDRFEAIYAPEPGYITLSKSRLLMPSRRDKKIYVFRGKEIYPLEIFTEMEDPIAIMAYSISHYMVLDKETSQIYYRKDDVQKIIGSKGSGKGQMLNPENFEVVDREKIYVLDTGNKRVLVFDVDGEVILEFGKEQNFGKATGITSDVNRIFISDYDKKVIYVYGHDGKFYGEIKDGFNTPSDLSFKDGRLYIANQDGPTAVFLKEEE